MPNLSALVISVLFCISAIWLIVEEETAGWFTLLVFGPAAITLIILGRRELTRERTSKEERIQRQKDRKAEIEEIRKLVSTNDIDVPENPVDVWKSLLIDEGADWVVFENGTLVVCEEGKPAEESALEIIGEFAEAGSGPSQRDFSVIIRPELGVWIISYPESRVFNYMELKTCASDSAAGMIAREIRTSDANQTNILHVHVVDRAEVRD